MNYAVRRPQIVKNIDVLLVHRFRKIATDNLFARCDRHQFTLEYRFIAPIKPFAWPATWLRGTRHPVTKSVNLDHVDQYNGSICLKLFPRIPSVDAARRVPARLRRLLLFRSRGLQASLPLERRCGVSE